MTEGKGTKEKEDEERKQNTYKDIIKEAERDDMGEEKYAPKAWEGKEKRREGSGPNLTRGKEGTRRKKKKNKEKEWWEDGLAGVWERRGGGYRGWRS